MGKIICFSNQKGGVGKTCSAHNTAFELAKQGFKTLIVDIDPSRNTTMPFGEQLNHAKSTYSPLYKLNIGHLLKNKLTHPDEVIIKATLNGGAIIENLYLLPSSRELAFVESDVMATRSRREAILLNQLLKVKENFDYIIIDCPSYLGAFSILAIYAADIFAILMRYESDAVSGIEDLFSFINEIKDGQSYSYKILRNNHNAAKTTMNTYIETDLLEYIRDGRVFKTIIRQDEEFVKAKAENLPILVYAPKSKGAEDYNSFSKELREFADG